MVLVLNNVRKLFLLTLGMIIVLKFERECSYFSRDTCEGFMDKVFWYLIDFEIIQHRKVK